MPEQREHPATLYGVQGFKENLGTMNATDWAKLRAGDNHGEMLNGKHRVMWFYDPAARDDFQGVFGGVQVTLHRKPDAAATSRALLNQRLAQQFGAK
ncbi:MAG: hypothetical protein KI788_03955 [Mameliella sp.]|nr:hypothetical protein [Mameliella sp.]